MSGLSDRERRLLDEGRRHAAVAFAAEAQALARDAADGAAHQRRQEVLAGWLTDRSVTLPDSGTATIALSAPGTLARRLGRGWQVRVDVPGGNNVTHRAVSAPLAADLVWELTGKLTAAGATTASMPLDRELRPGARRMVVRRWGPIVVYALCSLVPLFFATALLTGISATKLSLPCRVLLAVVPAVFGVLGLLRARCAVIVHTNGVTVRGTFVRRFFAFGHIDAFTRPGPRMLDSLVGLALISGGVYRCRAIGLGKNESLRALDPFLDRLNAATAAAHANGGALPDLATATKDGLMHSRQLVAPGPTPAVTAAGPLRPSAPRSSDTGAVSVTMAYIGMTVVLMVAILIGGGSVFAARARGYDVAAEAARAGAQQIDLAAYRTSGTLLLSPGAAQNAAQRYLHSAGATGTVTVVGSTVNVTATSHQRTPMLSAFGKPTVQVTSTASASPHTGGTP